QGRYRGVRRSSSWSFRVRVRRLLEGSHGDRHPSSGYRPPPISYTTLLDATVLLVPSEQREPNGDRTGGNPAISSVSVLCDRVANRLCGGTQTGEVFDHIIAGVNRRSSIEDIECIRDAGSAPPRFVGTCKYFGSCLE